MRGVMAKIDAWCGAEMEIYGGHDVVDLRAE